MKIIIAPDSFKGSLTAKEAALAMERGVKRVYPDATILLRPLGDGGEGTLDSLYLAIPGSRKVSCQVIGPLGEPVKAFYGLLGPDGKTAVVEMAAASGLALVPEDQRDPRETTTYGTGELIRFALGEPGVERLIVGLGGSATNDSGAGALQALGMCFFDRLGKEVPMPVRGKDLARIVRADRLPPALRSGEGIDIVIACDVSNPLCGEMGASYVFGPQKGATPEIAQEMDDMLAGFAPILDRIYLSGGGEPNGSIADRPGSGAAGGLAAGLLAFFPKATLRSGIEIVLDAIDFDSALAGADLVLAGEGRLDSQTLGGKAVSGVLGRASAGHVPVVAFAGDVEDSAVRELQARGLKAAFGLMPLAQSREDAMARAAELLEEAVAKGLGSAE